MKKFLLIFLSLIIITGCTIDINVDKESDTDIEEESSLEEDTVEEKIPSVGKKSSLDNPLKVGEYGIASKYNAVLEEYKDVDVLVKEIHSDSLEIVNLHNQNNPDNIIEKEDGFKYVVLDYEVVFYDFETESFGTDVVLDMEIVTTSNDNFVVNGVKHVVNIDVLKKDLGVVDGERGTVQVVFSISENVNNYLIKIGTIDHTIAYYKV